DETPKLDRIEGKLEHAMTHCPESGHIEIQNGKLDRMHVKIDGIKKDVGAFKGTLFKWVLSGFGFIALLIGIIVSVMRLM
ncbi:unnamed protein product, partial [marine sediment metagenome]